MATKLTDEEKEELAAMDSDELRIVIEESVRKRLKVKEDKAAYVKACNDLIGLQEARMHHAVKVLDERALAEGSKSVPPPPPPVM